MHAKRSYRLASRQAAGDAPSVAVHFGRSHPLADVVARHCTHIVGTRRRWVLACGACWEHVLRQDERFAVEFDLPRELTVDPSYVDEIAVDRACAGERVPLTGHELRTAVVRLQGGGLACGQIARRLHRDHVVIRRVLNALSRREVAA